jgi:8-oxo-dGTP diphosphatase
LRRPRRFEGEEAAPMSEAVVRVAAAVLLRGEDEFLLAQRPVGKVYAGYWEFPGGKHEPGETLRETLDRELREELGIEVRSAYPWLTRRYVYAHAHVELHFFRVTAWAGELHPHEGQAFAWQRLGQIEVAPLLPANAPILAALELPALYGLTRASEIGVEAQIAAAERALEAGLRLVQVREPGMPEAERRRLAMALRDRARPWGARVLLNGSVAEARELGLAGVHLTSRALRELTARPRDLLVGASCHDAEELALAARLEVDFAVLGPVQSTPTHPGAAVLGWARFAELAAGQPMPIYALGGLSQTDLDTAWSAGAQGLALRRGAWVPD